jgi:hypothetical protein
MSVREAKDFLVQQTAEQAALESVPLSDLEKRMIYFTESGECPEDPIALNDAFEATYDTEEYEKKISRLLRHARARLKKENPSSARTWDEAVQELCTGDHYLLVLLDHAPIGYAPSQRLFGWSFWKLLGAGILILVIGMVVFVIMLHYVDSGPPQ